MFYNFVLFTLNTQNNYISVNSTKGYQMKMFERDWFASCAALSAGQSEARRAAVDALDRQKGQLAAGVADRPCAVLHVGGRRDSRSWWMDMQQPCWPTGLRLSSVLLGRLLDLFIYFTYLKNHDKRTRRPVILSDTENTAAQWNTKKRENEIKVKKTIQCKYSPLQQYNSNTKIRKLNEQLKL